MNESDFRNDPHPVLDGIADPIIVIDRDFNLTYANKTVRGRTAGASPTGQKCYEVLHGRNHPCDPCPCLQTFETNKPYRVIRKTESTEGEAPSSKNFDLTLFWIRRGRSSAPLK
ncbi:MAG: PAS domain-containing protein [Candidatus Manganitrophus sp.]|nr:PAS domain-containing protein [Candidatus Manganitrophus sp.]WDT73107.1 MAG: PAS domain-containing protein [Candidatus Manganitrophus sp.]WDT79356.1 MAG: PAS domain-containing protein [Candidatus Manganitrophus sp.]